MSRTNQQVIRWRTDEPADGVIEYGTSQAFGSSDSHAALTQPHNMTLTGLSSGTLYYFRVSSKLDSQKFSGILRTPCKRDCRWSYALVLNYPINRSMLEFAEIMVELILDNSLHHFL